MIKSLSGASGHVSGTKFVFDETRTRFVYPQDKSFVVYFEWAALPGLHTISAVWKAPDGHAAAIPSDIKIETKGAEHVMADLAAYWIFDIAASDPSGIWTLETRVDGAPAGAHNFELYVPPAAKPAVVSEVKLPSTDEVYRATVPSLVLVHSLDAAGNRLDTAMGFVYAADVVATAFEAIDGASTILVEFSDGRTARCAGLVGYNRAADWALIPTPTGARAPLKRSSSSAVKIGDRVLAFTLEGGKNPVAAIVDVSGRERVGSPAAVRINPALPASAAGSPVLDPQGEVFGILGAWTMPGSRIPAAIAAVNATVWQHSGDAQAITPIELTQVASTPVALGDLTRLGVFTPPLTRFPSLTYATTTDVGTKRTDLPDRNVSDFAKSIQAFWVISLWARREKAKTVQMSLALFDGKNRKRVESAAKRVSLGETQTRVANSIPVNNLEPGTYRVDIYADGKPVWRTFVRVLE